MPMKARRTRKNPRSQGGFADLMAPLPSSTNPSGVMARDNTPPLTQSSPHSTNDHQQPLVQSTSSTSLTNRTISPQRSLSPSSASNQPQYQSQQPQEDWESLLSVAPKRRISPSKNNVLSKSTSFSRSPQQNNASKLVASTSFSSERPATFNVIVPSFDNKDDNFDQPPKFSLARSLNSDEIESSPQKHQPLENEKQTNKILDSEPAAFIPSSSSTSAPVTGEKIKTETREEDQKPKQTSIPTSTSTSNIVPSFLSGWDGADGWGDDPLEDTDPDDEEDEDDDWQQWALPSMSTTSKQSQAQQTTTETANSTSKPAERDEETDVAPEAAPQPVTVDESTEFKVETNVDSMEDNLDESFENSDPGNDDSSPEIQSDAQKPIVDIDEDVAIERPQEQEFETTLKDAPIEQSDQHMNDDVNEISILRDEKARHEENTKIIDELPNLENDIVDQPQNQVEEEEEEEEEEETTADAWGHEAGEDGDWDWSETTVTIQKDEATSSAFDIQPTIDSQKQEESKDIDGTAVVKSQKNDPGAEKETKELATVDNTPVVTDPFAADLSAFEGGNDGFSGDAWGSFDAAVEKQVSETVETKEVNEVSTGISKERENEICGVDDVDKLDDEKTNEPQPVENLPTVTSTFFGPEQKEDGTAVSADKKQHVEEAKAACDDENAFESVANAFGAEDQSQTAPEQQNNENIDLDAAFGIEAPLSQHQEEDITIENAFQVKAPIHQQEDKAFCVQPPLAQEQGNSTGPGEAFGITVPSPNQLREETIGVNEITEPQAAPSLSEQQPPQFQTPLQPENKILDAFEDPTSEATNDQHTVDTAFGIGDIKNIPVQSAENDLQKGDKSCGTFVKNQPDRTQEDEKVAVNDPWGEIDSQPTQEATSITAFNIDSRHDDTTSDPWGPDDSKQQQQHNSIEVAFGQPPVPISANSTENVPEDESNRAVSKEINSDSFAQNFQETSTQDGQAFDDLGWPSVDGPDEKAPPSDEKHSAFITERSAGTGEVSDTSVTVTSDNPNMNNNNAFPRTVITLDSKKPIPSSLHVHTDNNSSGAFVHGVADTTVEDHWDFESSTVADKQIQNNNVNENTNFAEVSTRDQNQEKPEENYDPFAASWNPAQDSEKMTAVNFAWDDDSSAIEQKNRPGSQVAFPAQGSERTESSLHSVQGSITEENVSLQGYTQEAEQSQEASNSVTGPQTSHTKHNIESNVNEIKGSPLGDSGVNVEPSSRDDSNVSRKNDHPAVEMDNSGQIKTGTVSPSSALYERQTVNQLSSNEISVDQKEQQQPVQMQDQNAHHDPFLNNVPLVSKIESDHINAQLDTDDSKISKESNAHSTKILSKPQSPSTTSESLLPPPPSSSMPIPTHSVSPHFVPPPPTSSKQQWFVPPPPPPANAAASHKEQNPTTGVNYSVMDPQFSQRTSETNTNQQASTPTTEASFFPPPPSLISSSTAAQLPPPPPSQFVQPQPIVPINPVTQGKTFDPTADGGAHEERASYDQGILFPPVPADQSYLPPPPMEPTTVTTKSSSTSAAMPMTVGVPPIPVAPAHVPLPTGNSDHHSESFSYSMMDSGITTDIDMTSPRPVICWGFGGTLAVSLSASSSGDGCPVSLMDMQDLIGKGGENNSKSEALQAASEAVSPVPLLLKQNGYQGEPNLNPLSDMCDRLAVTDVGLDGSEKESRNTMWRMLGVMIRSITEKGKPFDGADMNRDVKNNQSSDWRAMVLKEVFNESNYVDLNVDLMTTSTNSQTNSASEKMVGKQIEDLMSHGKIRDAVSLARESGLWSIALVLAGCIGKDVYDEVSIAYSKETITNISITQVWVLACAGRYEEINQSILSVEPLADKWKRLTFMMLNIRTSLGKLAAVGRGGDEFLKIIGKIGDQLSNIDAIAAHICYILSGRMERLGSDNGYSLILGGDKSVAFGRPRSYGCINAILMSMVLEVFWCWNSGSTERKEHPQKGMRIPFIEILPYKLLLCHEIISISKPNTALEYCHSISSLLRTALNSQIEEFNNGNNNNYTGNDSKQREMEIEMGIISKTLLTPTFINSLEELENRLMIYTNMVSGQGFNESLISNSNNNANSLSALLQQLTKPKVETPVEQNTTANNQHSPFTDGVGERQSGPEFTRNEPELKTPTLPPVGFKPFIHDNVNPHESQQNQSTLVEPAAYESPQPEQGRNELGIDQQTSNQRQQQNNDMHSSPWNDSTLMPAAPMPPPLPVPVPPANSTPTEQQRRQSQSPGQRAWDIMSYDDRPQPIVPEFQLQPAQTQIQHQQENSGNEKLMSMVSKAVGILAPGGELSPPPRQRSEPNFLATQSTSFVGGQTFNELNGPSGTRTLSEGIAPRATSSADMMNNNMAMGTYNNIQPAQSNSQPQAGGLTSDKKPPKPPKKVNSETALNESKSLNSAGDQKKKQTASKGWRARIAEKLYSKFGSGKVAHLGAKNEFIYDKVKQRWVRPGQEDENDESLPPPPADDSFDNNANNSSDNMGPGLAASVSYEEGMNRNIGNMGGNTSNSPMMMMGNQNNHNMGGTNMEMATSNVHKSQSMEDGISDNMPPSNMNNFGQPNTIADNGYDGRMYPGGTSFNSTPEKTSANSTDNGEFSNPQQGQYQHQNFPPQHQRQHQGLSHHRKSASTGNVMGGTNIASSNEMNNSNLSNNVNNNPLVSGQFGNPTTNNNFNNGGSNITALPNTNNVPPQQWGSTQVEERQMHPNPNVNNQTPANPASSGGGHASGIPTVPVPGRRNVPASRQGASANKFRAGSGRLSGRRAYVDTFNKGANMASVNSSAAAAPVLPNIPVPSLNAGTGGGGMNIFQPAPLPPSNNNSGANDKKDGQ